MRVDIGGGVRLFFDVAGISLEPTDEEMVRAAHPAAAPRRSWLRPLGLPALLRPFADTHQVVYLDHRGQGRSDARDDPSGWDLDTWADDVVRFCDALGIERPVVFGNSFGGFVAIRYAARHPDHPAARRAVEHAGPPPPEVSAARFEALGGPEARACYERIYVDGELDAGGLGRLPGQRACRSTTCSPRPFGPRRTWMNLRVLVHFNDAFTGLDLRADLGAIRCPTLVLVGEDDPMTPVEGGRGDAPPPARRARAASSASIGAGTAPSATSPSAPSRCSVPSWRRSRRHLR